ncbi:3-isopropylmalate dehydratase large subunit [Peribacillus castrilensis]|uniref:3-isopropylmalate dehydratase large subunit n=1 Tax=Peribacillus simplex TaxID=1478 RepID=A0AAN2PIB9_9BACI|nr:MULTISPECIES: 3-isopropylmalate dehydratase large subunit [Bacillaceae]MCF7622044.1 3-isopropylmalate dehydratase large subunit [Peribacillus frigoritolerans]MCP1156087.1 3-isopropylmalate dehydratase large subunit [Peribacillus frigoritolerans]MCT1391246.1 3-isopropylmalate dehydratase large subunit [Peribacillus frigoritolerans]MEE3956080.1 3-isopropylmalate dehydratase large subunit [Peribacillus frigoritolerans]PRA79874.1 3-isopropylmalate dehydratase large subunit [Peribacillus simplex
MGMTMSEKILARASGQPDVKAGEIVWVKVDIAMMHDLLGPWLVDGGFRRLGGKLFDKDKVVVVSDHCTPPATVQQADILKFTRDWARQKELPYYYEYEGPCHQVIVEHGHVRPGRLILGTDSHTCMAGGLGAFATGIGSTEMIGVLLTGETWLKVPETIKVVWDGKLPQGVYSKDLVLKTIKEIGHAGATYQTIEFSGSAIRGLSMDERLVLSNMAVEAGAKTGLIQPDETVADFLRSKGVLEELDMIKSDDDASFIKTLHFNASDLEPQVACPHEVDNVHPVSAVEGKAVDQVYLGSCTNGRLEDLRIAAQILKGKKVSKNIRCLVVPASQHIWMQANKEGILDILTEAGCFVNMPSCGACGGFTSGVIGAGEVVMSSSNRNFRGRMGSPRGEVFLGSPATVAATAIEGIITDPRKYLPKEVRV